MSLAVNKGFTTSFFDLDRRLSFDGLAEPVPFVFAGHLTGGNKMRLQSILMAGVRTACLLTIASIGSISARADTLGISYSNVGALTADPVLNGTILTLDALANGSILSGNPDLDAIWNPVSFHTHDMLDVTTGLDSGIFSITFANGDTLSGNLFEVDSDALLETNLGSFTQMLVFTGGTGEFAGASGSTTGGGVVGATTFTTSGSGTVSAPGVTPEPASIALFGTGLLGLGAFARNKLLSMRDK
jgi:PEP-CTERM motif-containing protein